MSGRPVQATPSIRPWLLLLALAAVVWVLKGGSAEHLVPSASASEQAKAVSVIWGGDLALSAAGPLPSDGRAGLGAITHPLMATDLALVNLEGTLGTSGTAKCGATAGNCFAFQAPPDIARQLAYAGVDAVNRANNHSFDAGEGGLAETGGALDAAEIAWSGLTGTTRRVNVAGAPAVLVGFAPYRWADDLRDVATVSARVRAAAAEAPLVIAMIHAGREGQDAMTTPQGRETSFGEDRGDTRAAAHAAIDAGADVVFGSGPHVVRGIELYRQRLIVYSTGNLAGDDTVSLSGNFAYGALVRLRLMPDGRPLSGRVIPLVLTPPGTPQRDSQGRAISLMDQAGRADFGAGAVGVGADGVLQFPSGA